MAAKRQKAIPKTTKGKSANYRPTKSGAGMTAKVLPLIAEKTPDLNYKQQLREIQKKDQRTLKEESLIVLDQQVN